MEVAFLIGRILLGLFFLMMASNHFFRLEMLSGYAASKGVPAPKLATLVSGLLLLIGGLSILTGLFPVVGVAALVVFFVPVNVMMHNFWAIDDPQQKMMEMTQFMKNTAILGATLMLLAIPTPWPFSLAF